MFQEDGEERVKEKTKVKEKETVKAAGSGITAEKQRTGLGWQKLTTPTPPRIATKALSTSHRPRLWSRLRRPLLPLGPPFAPFLLFPRLRRRRRRQPQRHQRQPL